jgi:hypothetical protein
VRKHLPGAALSIVARAVLFIFIISVALIVFSMIFP